MDIFHENDDRETTANRPTYEQQAHVVLYQCTITIISPIISTMLLYTEMGIFYNTYIYSFLTLLTGSMAQSFRATMVPLAARSI
jgi:hypothetical protein